MAKTNRAPRPSRSKAAREARARQAGTHAQQAPNPPGTRTDQAIASENVTDSTKAHGLGGPNPRQHPAATSQTPPARPGARAPHVLPRPGMTSDPDKARREMRLPPANARPRAAATSRAGHVDFQSEESKRLSRFYARVQATQMGYYDHTRRRPGDVFDIHDEEDFSERWMQYVTGDTPLSTTLGRDALKQQHDDLLQMRHGVGTKRSSQDPRVLQQGVQDPPEGTGDADVLDAGD